MPTIYEAKESEILETPVFLFECELSGGLVERWSTCGLEYGGKRYRARVLKHNLFEMQANAEEGVDGLTRISLTLANADSHFSQLERSVGFKGAKLVVRFGFLRIRDGSMAAEPVVIFRGTSNPPEEVTESTLRVTFGNRLHAQRLALPEVRIQKRCPWVFPENAEQRAEAIRGGERGKYSPFYRCGYAADIEDGEGNLKDGQPYASCDYTRAACEQRGMFSVDNGGRPTRRFGGLGFVPASTLVRSYGERTFQAAGVLENEARYNDVAPLVYGTAWYAPLIVFARNDGNLTHLEVLLGVGEISDVLKILVNDVEIPMGQDGRDMTATGWFNIICRGARTGGFNLNFTDAGGNPLGEPYGSMAAVSIVVPNRIADGRHLPRVQALVDGLKLPIYDVEGREREEEFTNNPAWVLLDVLQRCGWRKSELDVVSFARAAEFCGEPIAARDLSGREILTPRFQCNLAVTRRRSAADLIRGVRNNARLYLVYGADGKLGVRVESAISVQQVQKPLSSNSTDRLAEGWPAYEFGDGSSGYSGILRGANREPQIRFWSRSIADTPNRYTVEFQDALNEYQQDSLSLLDAQDEIRTGAEISASLTALGVPNFSQAARLLKLQLDKSIRGNHFVEFETSVRAMGLHPGDIVTLSYAKEGLVREPHRILKIAPGQNYETAWITAQLHRDEWYEDAVGCGGEGGRRQARAGLGLPRPLVGTVPGEDGEYEFEVNESASESADGTVNLTLQVKFGAPPKPCASAASIPLVSLAAETEPVEGTLRGGQTLYYAVSAIDREGSESALSFVVRAAIPAITDTNRVKLKGLAFAPGTAGFHVYRGTSPGQLLRIASQGAPAEVFEDAGAVPSNVLPPDENYDHANFYWRLEIHPPCQVTAASSNTVTSNDLRLQGVDYRGMVVRITRGSGQGQERTIASHTENRIFVSAAWVTAPDASSVLVIAEASWHFGALALSSPVQFSVPNRKGAWIHICGRSANAHDRESAIELAPLKRFELGGAGAGGDRDVPGAPEFTVVGTNRGTVDLVGVGFGDLENTRSITSGTLRLNYWDEVREETWFTLFEPLAAEAANLRVDRPMEAKEGTLLQIGTEILRVHSVGEDGHVAVERGCHDSVPAQHEVNAAVWQLTTSVHIIPFVKDFFGSPASGDFRYSIDLPNARLVSAEFFMSNVMGNSETSRLQYLREGWQGYRTHSGGQISLQVDGYLAIQSSAVPAVVLDRSHSVRDIRAVLREPATSEPVRITLRVDGEEYCQLAIPPGELESGIVDGAGLPMLRADRRLTMDITSVGSGAGASPGRDLTVTVRL